MSELASLQQQIEQNKQLLQKDIQTLIESEEMIREILLKQEVWINRETGLDPDEQLGFEDAESCLYIKYQEVRDRIVHLKISIEIGVQKDIRLKDEVQEMLEKYNYLE